MDKEKAKTMGTSLLARFYGRWWMILVEGLCLIAICGLTLFYPDKSLDFLVKVFGIYRIAMGVFYVVVGIANRTEYGDSGGFPISHGVVDILIGAVFLTLPGLIIGVFAWVVGFWSVIFGVIILVSGLRAEDSGRILRIVVGGLLTIFGLVSFFNPRGQVTFFLVMLAIVLGCMGVFFIIQALAVRRLGKEMTALKQGYTDYEVMDEDERK